MLDNFKDFKLVDYGFALKRDTVFSEDDITSLVFEKTKNGKALHSLDMY